VVFLVKIWLAWDFLNLYFPDPVFLNRLAAARVVLILGILHLLVLKKAWLLQITKKRDKDAYAKTQYTPSSISLWIDDLLQNV
jgi:hypothetical protein